MKKIILDTLIAEFTLQHFADFHGTAGFVNPETGVTTPYTPETYNAEKGVYEGNPGIASSILEYYTRVIIREAQPKLVHEQFGVNTPIPQKNGERAKWNRRKSIPKALKPLTEGITPDPSKMKMVPVYCDVYQYGDWLPYTDKVSWVSADEVVQEMSITLAEQYSATMDTVVREVLNGGSNYAFAKKNAGTDKEEEVHTRAQIDKTCIITYKDVFEMNAILSANNVPKKGEYYIAIAHPYVIHDLMVNAPDKMWQQVMSYAKPENIFKGEVGELGGFRFVKTSEAKIFKGKIIDKYDYLVVKTDAAGAAKEIAISEALTAEELAEIVDTFVNIAGTRYRIIGAENGKLTLSQGDVAATGLAAEVKANEKIYSAETGLNGEPVFSTLFMGDENTYGVTGIGGHAVEFIAKKLGEVGNDPLNQRGSVAWKATKGAVILNQENLIRFESGSSMSRHVRTAN